jgi:hypothetical protein
VWLGNDGFNFHARSDKILSGGPLRKAEREVILARVEVWGGPAAALDREVNFDNYVGMVPAQGGGYCKIVWWGSCSYILLNTKQCNHYVACSQHPADTSPTYVRWHSDPTPS